MCKKGLVFFIICDYELPLKQKFSDSKIVIITNYVVVSNVGIKRVDCMSEYLLILL